MEDQFYQKLYQILPEGRIKLKEPMENHTTLRIGGPADYFVTPTGINEIKEIISLCKKDSIPYYVLGNGSNLLVSDQGYRGLIIHLEENFSEVSITPDGIVTAQAGILLSKLANLIAKQGFTGFEFAAGIPGTLGGAVTMNAGAYGGEMKQCLTGAKVLDTNGNILSLEKEELELGYRTSILQRKDYILLEASMKLSKDNSDDVFARMQELNRQRREKQPLDQCSAGSTFKRPEGYFAGKLISDAGLRGYQIGGAAVSEKHCGFLINKDNASAKDFLSLIQEVVRIVEEKFGVTLEPEVRLLGDF
ncbi:MAG: UDP-N-acetylmuramate dehydrogenase [Clostridiales bacterium]|nr:UDP-N-acetylmuramate dehydrogenase [Clostridiales bacterium]